MKQIAIAILLFFVFFLVTAFAQGPDWPDWIWDNNDGLGFPRFPPGSYPVEHFGVSGTLTVGSDGSLYLNGSQFFVLGTTVRCLDASCQSIGIDTIFVDPLTLSQSYSTIVVHWSDWGAAPPTPAGYTTPTSIPPTSAPRPTPTARPTVTPMPTPEDCPGETFSQHPPSVGVLEIWPPNPVVRGQGGQGLRLTVRVTSHPVVHRWWTREVRTETTCAWHGDYTTGQADTSVCECTPDGSPGCWPGWGWEEEGEWYCQEHIELIPDPIEAEDFRAHARLHDTSIRWILTNLATKYPGAQVYHPYWDVLGAEQVNGCLANGQCILEVEAYFPFEDPGWYDIWVDGWTVGTVFTPPRTYTYVLPDPQPVYLMDTSLIPDYP